MENNLTKLLNKGVIKVKKKKTIRKTSNNKNYKDFLKRRNDLSMVNNVNPIKLIDKPIKSIDKPINSIDKPIDHIAKENTKSIAIDNKLDNKLVSNKLDNLKKITVFENAKQPIFSFDRSTKKKIKQKSEMKKSKKHKVNKVKTKKTQRKPRKISFTVKPKKNECDKFKKIKSDVEIKKSVDMIKELKEKGISISGKSNKLLKDVYMCIMNDNINIKKE